MVEDGVYNNFLPLNLMTILSWLFFHMITFALCNMVILKKKLYKSKVYLESKVWKKFSLSPNTLWSTKNVGFKTLRWMWKFVCASFPFVAHKCGYTTPKVIITSCLGKQHSSSSISPWIAPSYFSLTLLMAYLI